MTCKGNILKAQPRVVLFVSGVKKPSEKKGMDKTLWFMFAQGLIKPRIR